MSDWTWKDITAAGVLVVTFAGLLFGFYNGIRADIRAMRTELRAEMREMRTEMREELQAVHGTLSDMRERLAVIETEIGIPPRPVEQGPVETGVIKRGVTERAARALVPASLAWFVDVYSARPVRKASPGSPHPRK